jgi:hypothetical protein
VRGALGGGDARASVRDDDVLGRAEHDVDKVYLRYISGKFRLQKLERVTQTRKFIFTDCGSDVLARVSEWLDSYQIDENIKPI